MTSEQLDSYRAYQAVPLTCVFEARHSRSGIYDEEESQMAGMEKLSGAS